ncbi:hypothetical protein GCM10009809_14820 [Isoptericola hypogeus]|uniref:N-acetyltransferase domain-containing protein n=1 Tax=Isoptericola hypogeus TaxID=300179 RepID=A0ABN2J8H7_9MICO
MFARSLGDDGAELRPLEPWHAEELLATIDRGREFIGRFVGLPDRITDLDSSRSFLAAYAQKAATDTGRLYGIWTDGTLVGGVLFRTMSVEVGSAEAGCWLEPAAAGRGLVTRAARVIIDWAIRERGIHRVEWWVASGNAPSIAVARRLGMRRDGVLREHHEYRGVRQDIEVWSVLAPEWQSQPVPPGQVTGVELVGGVERREIVLVDPDPRWSARFEQERERILAALGPRATRVDHVGSTAVPGLAAKPIVDIDVSVPDVEDEDAYLPALLDAGYELRVREPGHRLVRTPARDVHVHVCSAGSDWERQHLLFRDRLRHDAGDRAAYAALKRELAAREWPSMNDYADAKGGLIAQITDRAEAWAAATGWQA